MSISFSVSDISRNMNREDCYHHYAQHWKEPDKVGVIVKDLLEEMYSTPKANDENAFIHHAFIRQRLIERLEQSFVGKIVALYQQMFETVDIEILRAARDPAFHNGEVDLFRSREATYWLVNHKQFLNDIKLEGWRILQNPESLQEDPIEAVPLPAEASRSSY